MDEKKTASLHRLMLERQKGGTITGIREVISFDEKEILLNTEEEKLEGRIDSLSYPGRKKDKKEESLLKRLFR